MNSDLFENGERWREWSVEMKKRHGKRIARIALDGGFTCPNRDGSKGYGGCAFCSSSGSGDTIAKTSDLKKQYQEGLVKARAKWPDCLPVCYFQSFSNTYASLERLKNLYQPFLDDPNSPILMIATRVDCLHQDFVDWLSEQVKKQSKEIWIEMGLQSAQDHLLQKLNCLYTTEDVQKAVELCQRAGFKTCLHLMNGLPAQSEKDMLENIRFVNALHPDAIKIHMLYLQPDCALAQKWLEKPWPMMSLEDYALMVAKQLELLDPSIMVARLSGDGLQNQLLAPDWSRNKGHVRNVIRQTLARRDSFQGRLFRTEQNA